MLKIIQGMTGNVMGFSAHGKVTTEDYKKTLIPTLDRALKQNSKIRFYYELGPDFSGYELGAMWEDLVYGMGHLNKWEKIAVASDNDWIRNGINVFRFLLPCPIQVFPFAQAEQAKKWLAE